jgi:hypothetical protein
MAVLKQWECRAHGNFEEFASDGEVPKCPSGCGKRFVRRVFLQPPGLLGKVTKNTDKTLRGLAADFKMTNLKNDKAGGSVMDAMGKKREYTWMPMTDAVKKMGKSATDLTALGFGKGMYGKNQVDARVVGKIPAPLPRFDARDSGGYSKDSSAP